MAFGPITSWQIDIEKVETVTYFILGVGPKIAKDQMVKNLPAMQETWVQSLDQEDLLEKGMATLCSILAWRIPWTEEPEGLKFMGLQRVGHD